MGVRCRRCGRAFGFGSDRWREREREHEREVKSTTGAGLAGGDVISEIGESERVCERETLACESADAIDPRCGAREGRGISPDA